MSGLTSEPSELGLHMAPAARPRIKDRDESGVEMVQMNLRYPKPFVEAFERWCMETGRTNRKHVMMAFFFACAREDSEKLVEHFRDFHDWQEAGFPFEKLKL
jgi:hypothetical protein